MKNILAENLLRFGVKNLSESDKNKLMEGTGPNDTFWQPLMKGMKQASFAENIPSVPFLNPQTGKQLQYVQPDGKQTPLFIGASISAKYDTNIATGGNSLQDSKRFYVDVTFFYAIKAGVTAYEDPSPSIGVGAKGVEFYTIKIAQLKNGKFYIVPFSKNQSLPDFQVLEGSMKTTMKQLAQNNVFGANVPGYTGTNLFNIINRKLDEMGYAILPANLTAPVTV